MSAHQLTILAEKLANIPVGEASKVIDNGKWKFVVHRYDDGWYVAWDSSVFDSWTRMNQDIGRVFRDPLDFINFILGDPSNQFVWESQDITV